MKKNTAAEDVLGGNWPALGNAAVIYFLSKNLRGANLAQAYIFAGVSDLGKFSIALTFAKNLLLADPAYSDKFNQADEALASPEDFAALNGDIHVLQVEADKKNISIEQTRAFIKILSLSSFLNSYKIGIIKGAENLSLEAANALLKTLEEPKEKVLIILTTNDLERLPATIVSRSQVLRFYPVSSDIIYNYLVNSEGCERSQARALSGLALGRPLRALKFLSEPDFYDNYLAAARVFAGSFSLNINERLGVLSSVWSARSSGREAVAKAEEILEIWQGLGRDLLLLNLAAPDLIQHHVLLGELKAALEVLAARLNESEERAAYLSNILNKISQAQMYLRANVGPGQVLENILINL